MVLRTGSPCFGLAFAVASAAAAGRIEVADAWSRATPPGAMGAAYLVITNQGIKPDRLLAASTPIAPSVEIDATRVVNGVSQMRPVPSLDVEPGKPVRLEPGGLHIMLMGLVRPLAPGTQYPLTLRFRDAGSITVQVEVRERP